jgi:CheY-like chemotaxis protein
MPWLYRPGIPCPVRVNCSSLDSATVGVSGFFSSLHPARSWPITCHLNREEDPSMPNSIFIIDDMPSALEITCEYLCASGFNSIVAYSDPLRACSDILAGGSPSLIITDYDMPGMNGLQLLEKVRAKCPHVRSVITTGAPDKVRALTNRYPVLGKADADYYSKLIELAREACG